MGQSIPAEELREPSSDGGALLRPLVGTGAQGRSMGQESGAALSHAGTAASQEICVRRAGCFSLKQ